MEKGGFIAIGIFIIMALTILYGLMTQVRNMQHDYICPSDFSIQCTDLSVCTNQSSVCATPAYSIYNASFDLCTNSSGVGVINESPSAGCSLEDYSTSATDSGLRPGDYALLSLMTLIFLAGIVMIIKSKSEN
jgi:hypothetical protein